MSTATTLNQPQRREDGRAQALKQYLGGNVRDYGMMVALAVIVVFFQFWTDGRLLYPNNVAALIQQNAYVFILAIGMVMVIVAGHIDLSVGSVVAFIGGVCGIAMVKWDMPWLAAVAISIALGAAVGAWHGFWVAYVGIPAFIVTLGGMLVFRGLAIVLVGTTVSGFPKNFNALGWDSLPNALGFLGQLDGMTVLIGIVAIIGVVFGQLRSRRALIRHELRAEPFAAFVAKLVISSVVIAYITYLLAKSAGGTPIVLIIVGALVMAYSFVMGNTVFGRHIYAMGGNLAAAKLSGVKTKRVNFMIFVNMGLLTGIAAVVTTARSGSSVAAAGVNFELDAIAAAFIGGTAVSGGIGKVSGAIVGALIMGVLNMGLSINSVSQEWQNVVKGLVLIIAVAFDILNKRRANAAQ